MTPIAARVPRGVAIIVGDGDGRGVGVLAAVAVFGGAVDVAVESGVSVGRTSVGRTSVGRTSVGLSAAVGGIGAGVAVGEGVGGAAQAVARAPATKTSARTIALIKLHGLREERLEAFEDRGSS